jgi:hypothetical protein
LAEGSFLEKKDNPHIKPQMAEDHILAQSAIVEAEVED